MFRLAAHHRVTTTRHERRQTDLDEHGEREDYARNQDEGEHDGTAQAATEEPKTSSLIVRVSPRERGSARSPLQMSKWNRRADRPVAPSPRQEI